MGGIDAQTVLDAFHAFKARELASRTEGPARPKRTYVVFGTEQAEGLHALLRRA